jgi:hypothetical protein
MKPYIPKEHPDIPDFYSITVTYHDGKSDTFEVVSHKFHSNLLDLVLKDDLYAVLPVEGFRKVELDKNFSKLVELKNEQNKKSD